ncbi:MAG: putative lipid II flippase FtsW [Patescibacteria group bacterium]
MTRGKIDKVFLAIVISLVVLGVFVFSSASLGILVKNEAKFYSIIFNQIILGLTGGLLALTLFSRINYRVWRKYAFFIFLFAIIVSTLVFVPGIGLEHNGAKRWILLGSFSFQPSELLKIAFVIYFAAWLSSIKDKITKPLYSFLPFIIIAGICAVILIKEPDIGTLIVLFVTGIIMLFVAGARLRMITFFGVLTVVGVIVLSFVKPYLKARILTFLNPAIDPLGASYQLQQSLIAIGSGGIFGRGFGQSIQKFNFLPEPVGDSIFAVYSEEFGLIGAVILITLFLAFTLRGLKIANTANDGFGKLLAVGLVMLIFIQSFINIGSMIGLVPLTGVPVAFISHGGTALLFALTEVGILLNISRYAKG